MKLSERDRVCSPIGEKFVQNILLVTKEKFVWFSCFWAFPLGGNFWTGGETHENFCKMQKILRSVLTNRINCHIDWGTRDNEKNCKMQKFLRSVLLSGLVVTFSICYDCWLACEGTRFPQIPCLTARSKLSCLHRIHLLGGFRSCCSSAISECVLEMKQMFWSMSQEYGQT